MEFENIEMIENVDEAMKVAEATEEIIPKKGFKLSAGKGVLIATVVTAVVAGVVALVKNVCANKAEQNEPAEDESDDAYDAEPMDISDSDVEDE